MGFRRFEAFLDSAQTIIAVTQKCHKTHVTQNLELLADFGLDVSIVGMEFR